MSYWGLFQLTLLAGLGFAATMAVLCAATYPLIVNHLHRLEPVTRARVILGMLGVPIGIGVLLSVCALLPSLMPWLGMSGDHCHVHGNHHPHLCLQHPPLGTDSLLAWIILLMLAMAVVWYALRGVRDSLWRRRFIETINKLSCGDSKGNIRWINWQLPLAFTSGILYSRIIYGSTSLVKHLSARQLEVVLAHECAHRERQHNLWRFVAGAISIFHLPTLRRILLNELELAFEQICDEIAASCVGSRVQVAETIVKVEKQFTNTDTTSPLGMTAFRGSNVIDRVESLLTPPASSITTFKILTFPALVLLVVTVIFAVPLHHFTETLLGILLR